MECFSFSHSNASNKRSGHLFIYFLVRGHLFEGGGAYSKSSKNPESNISFPCEK